jgi:hypothetical protein
MGWSISAQMIIIMGQSNYRNYNIIQNNVKLEQSNRHFLKLDSKSLSEQCYLFLLTSYKQFISEVLEFKISFQVSTENVDLEVLLILQYSNYNNRFCNIMLLIYYFDPCMRCLCSVFLGK